MALNDPKKNLNDLLRAGGYENEPDAAYSSNLAEASKTVQRRVKALKKNQLESILIESQFYQRVHQLEKEFQPLFDAVQEKRRAIVTGEREPEDAECDLPLVHGLEPAELAKLENEAPVEGSPSKGVPDFWYHVLNNSTQVSESIHKYDAPILKYLTDVTSEVQSEPNGFTLVFHFAENPYFTNTTLTKSYALQLTPDEAEPFDYEGPSIVSCHGEQINWREGKNVTQKVVKKKQKKGGAAGRFVTKTVANESFFNFFEPSVKTLSEDMDPELEEKLQTDFEMGQIIRDQIIPRAVLFYTGEAAEEEDFFDEDDDEEDGDDDSDDDE